MIKRHIMLWCIGKFIRKRKLSDLGFDNFFCFGIIMIEDRRGVVMKMRRYIFILMALVGILVFPNGVMAADLKLTYNEDWNKCINNTFVLPSYDNDGNIDGNLVVYNSKQLKRESSSSSLNVAKLDLNNKIVYKDKKFEASNVDVSGIDSSNTEGYVVKGKSDILITVYDDDGNIAFKKQYGDESEENGGIALNSYNSKAEHDGYLIIFEKFSSNSNADTGYFIMKLDLKGNVVWTKQADWFLSLEHMLLVRQSNDIFVFRVNNNSTLINADAISNSTRWKKETGIEINNINYSYDKNGKIDGVVVAGYSDDDYYIGTIIKYDLDGNEIFRSSYDGKDIVSVYIDVAGSYLPDGTYDGYIVTAASSDNRTFLVKYDLNGKKVYEIVYSNNSNIVFKLVNNFDKFGNQNGYLLYSTKLKFRQKEREIETQNETALPGQNDCTNLIIAKYTYDMFPVDKKEADGGSITVKSDAYPGELVKVNVVVKEGYTLARIIVKDETGKEIELNSDGTFVMPEGKVTVSAIYKRITNPDTVSAAYMVLGIVLLIAVGSLIVIKNKNRDM